MRETEIEPDDTFNAPAYPPSDDRDDCGTEHRPTAHDLAWAAWHLLEARVRGIPLPEYERMLTACVNDIAAIVANTFAERGDLASLADDEALMHVRDRLLALDPSILYRTRGRRIP